MQINFEHNSSAHCENGVTLNLLKFHQIYLTEPMVFGIGSGLFFSYMPFIKLNSLPVSSFRPYPGLIFKRVTKLLGIKITKKKYSNPEKAMLDLDKLLGTNTPIGLLVGVFYLPYFPAEYRFHFNAHNIVVFGKDNDKYLVSDPVMENVEFLTPVELKRVRFSLGTFPPKGRMYYISGTPVKIDVKNAILKGIKKNCRQMLGIPLPMFGVKGIRYLSRKMRLWPKNLGEKKAALYLGQLIRMLEEIGTGGAGFRFIYAAFLQQSAVILNIPALNEISMQMTEVGDQWRNFAWHAGKLIKSRSNAEYSYSDLADFLLVIADKEEEIFKKLEKIVSGG